MTGQNCSCPIELSTRNRACFTKARSAGDSAIQGRCTNLDFCTVRCEWRLCENPNLRVIPIFRQSENQKFWRRPSEEGNREDDSALFWLAHGSQSLGGEGTFSAPANLTRPSSPIAAPMRDQLEWRLDRRPLHQKPGRELGYTRYDKMARRWAGKSNMSKSPR